MKLINKTILRLGLVPLLVVMIWFGFGYVESSQAAINPLVNFSGKVTNTDGTEIADGVYNFSFGLYTVPIGGSSIWSEDLTAANMFSGTINSVTNGTASSSISYTSGLATTTLRVGQNLYNANTSEAVLVMDFDTTIDTITVASSTLNWTNAQAINNRPFVEGGVIDVDLGTVTDLSSVDYNQPLYLEITFNGETMKPRRLFDSVTQAFNADKLDGYDSSDFLLGLGDTTITGEWTFDNILQIATTSAASTALTVTQSGTGDIINLYDGTNEIFTIVDGGNVGIGTTSPFANLSIAGSAGQTTPLFIISTSTATFATSTAFLIDANGKMGVGSVGGFSDTPVKLADPASLPTNVANDATFSPDGTYLVVAYITSPYINIYKRSGDTFTKLANPAALPTSWGYGASFSPDGTYLAIAHGTSPYITIYKRSGDTFTKLADPADLPAGTTGRGISFSPDGNYLAIVHNTSPFVTIYKRSGDTFTKLTDPADLPAGSSHGATFSPNGSYLVISSLASPYIIIYKRSGDTFTKLANPAALPTSGVFGASFTPDSTYLAIARGASPYVTIYKRSGDTFTKLTDPADLPPNIPEDISFSPDGNYLAVVHRDSPFVTIYKRSGDTFTKIANPAELPAENGHGVDFSPDGAYLAIAHSASPYVTIYKGSGGPVHQLELALHTTAEGGIGIGKELSLYRSGPNMLSLSGGNLNIDSGALLMGGVSTSTTIIDANFAGYFSKIAIGTTTQYSKLTVWGDGTSGLTAFNVVDSASTTLFTVLDNGNVGIGTSSPSSSYVLDVYGDTRIDGNLYLNGNIATSVGAIIGNNDNIIIGDAGTDSRGLVDDDDLFISGKLEVDGYSHFEDDLYSYNIIRSSGSGIRLDDNNTTLSFGNSVDAKINWETQDADANYLSIMTAVGSTDQSGNIIFSGDYNVDWGHDFVVNPTIYIQSADETQTNDYLKFYHNQTDAVMGWGNGNLIFGNGAATTTIDSSGKIGIGTTSPFANLSIAGIAGQVTPLFAISTSTAAFATSTAFIIDSNGNVGIGNHIPDEALTIGTSTANQKIKIYGNQAGSLRSYEMYMGSNGRLILDGTNGAQGVQFSDGINVDGTSAYFNVNAMYLYDDQEFVYGTGLDMSLGYHSSTDTFRIVDGNDLDNNTRFTIDSSGNIGVGTSTPYARLSVWASSTSGLAAFEVVDSASTTLFTVLDNGNVGIGTTTPGYVFSLSGNPQAVDGVPLVQITGTFTNVNENYGLYVVPVITPSGASSKTYVGGVFSPTSASSNLTSGSIYGVQGSPSYSGAGTLGNLWGGYFVNSNNGAGTVTSAYGVFINDAINSGTITNNIGLLINNMTAGSNANYAIYSAGGQSYHAGNFGIGTTSPFANLSIAGSAGQTTPLFAISTSTAAYATSTAFVIDSNGNVGIGLTDLGSVKFTVAGGGARFVTAGESDFLIANSSGVSYLLGNTGSQLALGANLGEAMRIDLNNRVGIGTTSPSSNLSIAGSAGQTTSLFAISTSTAAFATSTAFMIDSNGDVGIGTTTTSNYNLTVQGSIYADDIYTSGSTFYMDGNPILSIGNTGVNLGASSGETINLSINDIDALVVDANRNIGIGTSTPYSKLTVWGDSTSGLTAFNVVDSASTTLFTVLDNGNVGIGTTTPDELLHIEGSSPGIKFYDSGTSDRFSTIGMTDAYNMVITAANGGNIILTGYTKVQDNDLIAFGTDNDYSMGYLAAEDSFRIVNGYDIAVNERFVIDSSGNVGISSSSPQYTLDVGGYINTGEDYGYKINGTTVLKTGTSSLANLFVGQNVGGANMTGAYNTYIGYDSGNSGNASNNTFVGYGTGNVNTTGSDNTFMGYQAGVANTIGTHNTFIGSGAGIANTEGIANIFLGAVSGQSNTTGIYNAFMGYGAGASNTIGYNNTFLGIGAGLSNVGGADNTFIGYHSGYNNTTGASSTILGYQAGYSNTTGDRNVFLGYQAGYYETGSNKLYIDNSSTTAPLIYGDFSNDILAVNGQLGVGTTTPYSKLTVWGDSTSGLSAFEVVDSASTTLFTVLDNGYVGIGIANPNYPVHATSTAVDSYFGNTLFVGSNMNSTSNYQAAIYGRANAQPTSASTQGYYGGFFETLSSSNNLTGGTLGGVLGRPAYSGSGTLLSAVGLGGQVIASGGTISNAFGIYLSDNAETGGSITNNYGLFIADRLVGTSNYALFSEGGLNYFGDNVGVGTTSPFANLSIAGSAGQTTPLFAVSTSTAAFATSTAFMIDSNGKVVLGTSAYLSADSDGVLTIDGQGSSGSFITLGDASEEDTGILLDGNIRDFYIGLDDTDDTLHIGPGQTVGTNPNISIASDGHVGIGTTSPYALFSIATTTLPVGTQIDIFSIATSTDEGSLFRVDTYGNVYADGIYYGRGGVTSGSADYAEYFYSVDADLESGEVVCVDITRENAVERCKRGSDSNVMGIVSTQPALLGNHKEEYEDNVNYKIVGMLGQVPGKVSAENGPIRPGDSLTSASSSIGYAMRSNAGDPTVGVALEGLASGQGTINVLISRRNKSLTVEMVEAKITNRIASMEIEDEVQILIADAVKNLDLDEEVGDIVDEQIDQFDARLTVEFDAVENQITTIAASFDSVITRMSMVEQNVLDIETRLAQLENIGFGLDNPSLNLYLTDSGGIKIGNNISTTTPEVAIIEIDTLSEKTALVVNQAGVGDVADFQAESVSIVNIAETGRVTVVGEMLVDGRLMICSGGACGSTLDEAVDETMGDLGVEGKVVAGAFEGYCEDGFIWVPGSAKYGTLPGFCVMKYNANVSNDMQIPRIANDANDGEIWVNISQGEAQIACQGIGDGYHLISENEWLTIAENIIRVAENDIDELLEGLQLATSTSLSAGTPPEDISYKLSNDNVIYNLVGGVSEWTDQTITKLGLIEPVIDLWQEYYEVEDYQGFNIAPPYYYNSSNGIGKIKTSDNENSLRGFVRGFDGIYSLDLSNPPTVTSDSIGFRCAR